MKEIHILLFVCSVAPFALVYGQNDSVCPNLKIQEDVSDPFVAQRYKRQLTAGIWATPQLASQLTPLSTQLRDIILDMSNSDSFYFTEFAFQFTGWSTCFLAQPSYYYSFCPFATVINKTVQWQKCGDIQYYLESLNVTVDSVPYALSALEHASLSQLTCRNVSEPISRPKNCWENGLVSDEDEIWDIFGRLLPWPLRHIAAVMANSTVFSDRAYATMLAFIATPAQYYYFTHQSYPLLFETARYYINAQNNSKCCCLDWKLKQNQLNKIHTETAQENAQVQVDSLKSDCAI